MFRGIVLLCVLDGCMSLDSKSVISSVTVSYLCGSLLQAYKGHFFYRMVGGACSSGVVADLLSRWKVVCR